MKKSAMVYKPDDIALAAFNKVMALPDCVAILYYLRTQGDWTETSTLKRLEIETEQITRHLNSLTKTKIVSTKSQNGFDFYRLNRTYIDQLTLKLNALTQQISNDLSK